MDHIFKYKYKTFGELLTFESYSSLAYESGYVKNTHIKADNIISFELSGKKTSQIRLAYDEITFYFLYDKKIFRKKLFLCKQLPLIINSLCGYIMLKENFGLKFPYASYTKAKFQK